MTEYGDNIGDRIRKIRESRKQTLEVIAQLSGFSKGYLSQIERGLKPLDRRQTLEKIAAALDVAPSVLASVPWPASDTIAGDARLASEAIGDALADYRIGDEVEIEPRSWPEIAVDIERLRNTIVPNSDYVEQGRILPALIEELHALYRQRDQRTNALVGLAYCYSAACGATKSVGASSLSWVAADRLVGVTERIARPEFAAWGEWRRAHMVGSRRRDRQISQATKSIDNFAGEMQNEGVLQAVGQLHLTTAMAYASQGKYDDSSTHLNEAARLSRDMDSEVGRFGGMWFGRSNVGIWQVALAVESGDYGRAIEISRTVNSAVLPSAGRQADFHANLGRAFAQDRRTHAAAVREIVHADNLAPQLIRNNPLVRETVSALSRKKLPEKERLNLSRLAHTMGIRPNG